MPDLRRDAVQQAARIATHACARNAATISSSGTRAHRAPGGSEVVRWTDADMVVVDPLGSSTAAVTGAHRGGAGEERTQDAVLTGTAQISGIPVVLAVRTSNSWAARWAASWARKLTRAAERAFSERKRSSSCPLRRAACRRDDRAHAAREDGRSGRSPRRSRIPFISVPRCDDGRRARVVRIARRHCPCSPARSSAFRRSCDERAHRREAAEGLSTLRVPARHGFVISRAARPAQERIAFLLNAFRVAGQDLRWEF